MVVPDKPAIGIILIRQADDSGAVTFHTNIPLLVVSSMIVEKLSPPSREMKILTPPGIFDGVHSMVISDPMKHSSD